MGTRSRIGIVTARDGDTLTITSIYCHYDGYVVGGVGATLQEHYQDPDKVRALMDLGDISSLGEEIGVPHDFDFYQKALARRPAGVTRLGDLPESKMCHSYGRDRGETGTEARETTGTLKDYAEFADKSGGEYAYLFFPAEFSNVPGWHVADLHVVPVFVPLAEALEADKAEEAG